MEGFVLQWDDVGCRWEWIWSETVLVKNSNAALEISVSSVIVSEINLALKEISNAKSVEEKKYKFIEYADKYCDVSGSSLFVVIVVIVMVLQVWIVSWDDASSGVDSGSGSVGSDGEGNGWCGDGGDPSAGAYGLSEGGDGAGDKMMCLRYRC